VNDLNIRELLGIDFFMNREIPLPNNYNIVKGVDLNVVAKMYKLNEVKWEITRLVKEK
jgi:hypothetical protein